MSSIEKIEEFCREAVEFANRMIHNLEISGLADEYSSIDHICYRTTDLKSYEKWKVTLEKNGVLLSEAYINKRPISTFRLAQPLSLNRGFTLNIIELPSPIKNRPYGEGFEHIEVITNLPLEGLFKKRPDLNFKTTNMSAEINPDISLNFEKSIVKFHESTLEKIIEIEKRTIKNQIRNHVAIIDFDDTIIDSKKIFLASIQAALSKYLQKEISSAMVIEMARPTFPEFFANFGIKNR